MFEPLSKQNYYQVLELPYDATPDQIQLAYEEARKIYNHGALVSGSILSEDERRHTFERIAEAYQTLIAEESRRLYDESLGLPLAPERERPRPHRSASTVGGFGKRFTAQERDGDLAVGTSLGDQAPSRAESEAGSTGPEASPPRRFPSSEAQPLQLGLTEEATGEFIRRAREAMGLELDAIAEETKIGVTMLRYIEEERVDLLPAAVYLRNFTLQVARCLGLDEDKVSRTYLARIRRMKEPSAQA